MREDCQSTFGSKRARSSTVMESADCCQKLWVQLLKWVAVLVHDNLHSAIAAGLAAALADLKMAERKGCWTCTGFAYTHSRKPWHCALAVHLGAAVTEQRRDRSGYSSVPG